MKKGPAGTAGPFLLCESQRTLRLGVILFLALFRSRARPAGAPTAAATSRRFLLLLLLARFANQRLARQPHLVALNRKHLDQHLVAQLQLIADVPNAMLGISLMCSKPSVPGNSSTNAPNSASRTTLPR